MARRRSSRTPWLLALLALLAGTVSLLLTRGGPATPGGPHDLRWRPLPPAGAAAGQAAPAAGADAVEEEPSTDLPVASLPSDLLVRVLDEAASSPVSAARVEAEDANGVWSGRSDAGGEVRFGGLEAGTVQVRVLLDGALVGSPGARVSPEAPTVLEVRVAPSVRIAGRVLSSFDDRPIAGATVAVEVRNHDRRFLPPPVRSGPDGSYSLPAGKAGDWVSVVAVADGFVRGSAYHPLPAGGGPLALDFHLDPAVAVSGRVLDPEGRPVPGAVVVAEPAGGDHALPDPKVIPFLDPGARPVAAASGPDGAYRLDGLAPGGAYRIAARKEGFAPSREGSGVLLPGDGGLSLDLTLQAAGEIHAAWSGREGRGVVNAWVRVRDASGATVAESFGPGSCRLPGIAPGICTVIVTSERDGSARGTVAVRAGETVGVELALGFGEGVLADGIVVDGSGTPVPRARVFLVACDDGETPGTALAGEGFPLEVGVERDGRFALDGGGASIPSARILVRAPGFLDLLAPPRDLPVRGLRLVLSRGGTLTGRVVLPDRDPVREDAAVALLFEPGKGSPVARRASWREVATGFRFEGLPAGPGRFSARVGAFMASSVPVEVPDGGEADLGEVRLAPGSVLEGRVLDGDGRPVPGARVMPEGDLWWDLFAEAGSDGRFTLAGLPEEPVALLLTAPGFARTRVSGEAGRGPLELVLARGGLLRVAARTGSGGPLSGGVVRIRDTGGRTVEMTLDARGRGELRLAGEVYRVSIQGTGGADAVEVRVDEGGTVDLELAVR